MMMMDGLVHKIDMVKLETLEFGDQSFGKLERFILLSMTTSNHSNHT